MTDDNTPRRPSSWRLPNRTLAHIRELAHVLDISQAAVISIAVRRLAAWVHAGWRPPEAGDETDPPADPTRIDIH